jgi:GWxTD domain-containing protein
VNPRGWYRFGLDSIFLYLEAYRLQEPRNVSVQVRTRGGAVLWEDSVAFGGRQEVEGITILIPDSVPAFGWTEVVATLPGKLPLHVPIFVTVSDRWPIASLDALDTMLTFFGPEADGFLRAPAAERREQWRTFWTTTDDLRTVGVNETLDRFFMAIDSANAHFAEPSIPGWLTDRGEVILSIGLPEFIIDDGPIAVASGSGPLLWEYPNLGVTLSFVRGRQGTLRWSLHPRSEVDFRRAVRRYRELYGNRRPWLHQGILGESSQHTDPGR